LAQGLDCALPSHKEPVILSANKIAFATPATFIYCPLQEITAPLLISFRDK